MKKDFEVRKLELMTERTYWKFIKNKGIIT